MASGKRPRFSRFSESPPHSHGGGGGGITGGRAAGSGSGEVRGDRLNLSMAFSKFVPVSRLSGSPPHSRGGGGDGITGDGAGSGSGEVRGDRLNRSDQIARRDRSKGEQFVLYGSPLSSHRGHKSGGGREPADRFQEDFYSHSGMGKGGGRPYGDGYDGVGSSSQPFRGE